jgi:hypothetical protein
MRMSAKFSKPFAQPWRTLQHLPITGRISYTVLRIGINFNELQYVMQLLWGGSCVGPKQQERFC